MGERESGGAGEWGSGRVGERESRGAGESGSGRVGEREKWGAGEMGSVVARHCEALAEQSEAIHIGMPSTILPTYGL